MLTDTDDFELHERCSSPEYRDCPLLKNADPYPHDMGNEDHCPRLRSAFVQYCDNMGLSRIGDGFSVPSTKAGGHAWSSVVVSRQSKQRQRMPLRCLMARSLRIRWGHTPTHI